MIQAQTDGLEQNSYWTQKSPKHLSLFWCLSQSSSHLPLFPLVFHYISIDFSNKLNTQAPGQQKPKPPGIPKLSLLQENQNCLPLATPTMVIFLSFKGREVAKYPLWQADDSWSLSGKVWDQHQALGCHGSKCLLDMESQSYTQTGTGASEFKGTMSLWDWSKLTLKTLYSPRGGTETSKELLISL